MSCPLRDQHSNDDSSCTSFVHGGARPKVIGHRDQHLNDVNGCRVEELGDSNEGTDGCGWVDLRQSKACQKHGSESKASNYRSRGDLFSDFHLSEDVKENGVSDYNRNESDNYVDVNGGRGKKSGERTVSRHHASPGNCCRHKSSRHEHHFSYPLLQWAFGGLTDTVQERQHGDLFDAHTNHTRKQTYWDDFSTNCHSVCSKDPKSNLCKSQSLMLTKTSDAVISKPACSQVNHISLYDEADEIMALERWRNAGLALRRVLTSKAASRHKGDNSDEPQEEGSEKVQISPECQNVVDEIFEDVDEDTLKNVGSSSTCSTSESPEVFSLSEQPADQTSQSSRQRCEALQKPGSLDRSRGIWDSQLYPTDMSGQFELSPDQGETDTGSEGRAGGESGLFPWRQGATLLGACLFPQCMGIIGGRRHIGVWGKGEGGDMCNDQKPTQCNKDSKLNCDIKYYDGKRAMMNGDSQLESAKEESVPIRDNGMKDNRVKQNRLSWNTEDDRFVFDSEDGATLPTDEDKSSCVRLSGSQCTSSFHSEDSHGDATKSSGYHGDKGGESDVSDYSSACDGSGDIYFYEDSDRFDTVPRRQKQRDKSSSPFKKTLQREKKKKLVHARKTHKRKSSSSSTDVMLEDNNPGAQSTDTTQPFQSVYEPCPSFITCDNLNSYDQGQITPPRRSVSIARHFLDRGRSRDRTPASGNAGLFRTRDVSGSELSPLPNFDISPLSRLPSFLESLQNSTPRENPPPKLDQHENLCNSVSVDIVDRSEASESQADACTNSCVLDGKDIGMGEKGEGFDCDPSPSRSNVETSGVLNNVDEKINNVVESLDARDASDRGGNSLLSPDSWIRLIDEIYQPIVCESDAGEESALSDTETEKAENKTPDFFRCLDTTDKSSDSGDADDEFECECDHCQLLRSLDRPSRFLPAITATADTADGTGEARETTQRGDPWEADWAQNNDENFDINLDDLRPLEPFLLSLQDLPQDPVDLMFQNVITQMLAVHPELLGEQAPPPVSQSVIDRLPALTATNDNIDDDLTCPVCLCRFELGEEMTHLPCHHRYHPLCIQAWLAKSGTCPVCRHSLHNQGQVEAESEL